MKPSFSCVGVLLQHVPHARLQYVTGEGAQLQEVLNRWLYVFGGGMVQSCSHEGLVQSCSHGRAGEEEEEEEEDGRTIDLTVQPALTPVLIATLLVFALTE